MNTPTPSITISTAQTGQNLQVADPKIASKLLANQIAARTASATGVKATVEDGDSNTRTHYRPTSDSRGTVDPNQRPLQNPLTNLRLTFAPQQPQTPSTTTPSTTSRSTTPGSAITVSSNGQGTVMVSTNFGQNLQSGQSNSVSPREAVFTVHA